jgi:hypothetical protein
VGSRWGTDDPPPEAYERVTNPERFAPLHGWATETLDRLEEEFDVTRAEEIGLDIEIDWDAARPAVQLAPRDPEAGTLAVGFTRFPGLIVRLGRWLVEPIPICGCDACDETAEEGRGRLGQLVDALVNGRFRERMRVPPLADLEEVDRVLGGAWYEYEIPNESSESRVSRARARSLIEAADGKSSFRYAPWPPRGRP